MTMQIVVEAAAYLCRGLRRVCSVLKQHWQLAAAAVSAYLLYRTLRTPTSPSADELDKQLKELEKESARAQESARQRYEDGVATAEAEYSSTLVSHRDELLRQSDDLVVDGEALNEYLHATSASVRKKE